jgi:hypothetical protein
LWHRPKPGPEYLGSNISLLSKDPFTPGRVSSVEPYWTEAPDFVTPDFCYLFYLSHLVGELAGQGFEAIGKAVADHVGAQLKERGIRKQCKLYVMPVISAELYCLAVPVLGLDELREAIVKARGGQAPVQVQGFA